MTIDQLMEIGRVNSKTASYKSKKRKAIDVCCEQILKHERPYAALSGGKDSVAMAFIVNDAANITGKDFSLWSHISDASFPGTIETCEKVSEMTRRRLDVFQPGFSAFERMDAPKRMEFGKKGVFFDSVRAYAKDKDLSFVGVRAYESKRRMKAAKAHGMVFYSADMGNVDVVNPLQWFRLADVASALYEYDAPIHPIYRKFCTDDCVNANKEPMFIRLGYITSKDLLDRGTAVFMKTNYPDIYNKLVEYFPEIKNHC